MTDDDKARLGEIHAPMFAELDDCPLNQWEAEIVTVVGADPDLMVYASSKTELLRRANIALDALNLN